MIFNQTAYFGRGAIKEIPTEAKARGFTKAFIVTDPVLVENGTVKKVTDVLDEAVQAVAQLTRDLGNPTTISEVGATEEDLEPLAADAFADVCTPGNPRKATQEDILEIYRSLM
nr:iron-containing alcohol dehydrogenase [Bifidobacterium pseudolongum]